MAMIQIRKGQIRKGQNPKAKLGEILPAPIEIEANVLGAWAYFYDPLYEGWSITHVATGLRAALAASEEIAKTAVAALQDVPMTAIYDSTNGFQWPGGHTEAPAIIEALRRCDVEVTP